MNLLNFNFDALKQTGVSLNLINISWTSKRGSKEAVKAILLPGDADPARKPVTKRKLMDRKTPLGGTFISSIGAIEEDVILYLFISKQKTKGSEYHLITPVAIEKKCNRIYQFNNSCFALEGMGGGINNIDSLFYNLSEVKRKGYRVTIVTKVIENEYLSDYEYFDSNLHLHDLISNSWDIESHRKDRFVQIYQELLQRKNKYQLQ
jgi:hypothetical protein